ncbi:MULTISPECIES: Acg family FMN-binding oxidoreductase [unclassified Kribbella]|uniref:Acg family FMN-binding oxidoreductase n=1 Tax=unclassified Kribbella TaxID=2644121 RepID=UPI003017799A
MSTTKTLTQDEVSILLTAAVHAPSMHNTQPWRFEIDGPVIDILLDPERTLPASDPADRLTRIGLGAAAFNVRVAAALLGHESTFAIDPDPATPEVIARIFLADRGAPVPDLSSLYGAIGRRHTYRGPMTDQTVSPKVIQSLIEAARSEGAELRVLNEAQRSRLAGILQAADLLELRDEDRLHERARWIGGDRSTEGVPDQALGPLPVGPAAFRDLSAGFDRPHRGRAVFEETPAIMVLSTDSEDEPAWVQAGLALQRVLLTATSYKVAASFLNQVVEFPAVRNQVRNLIAATSWPQLVIRLGYPTQESGHTPRRPWNDALDHWH